MLQLGGTEFLAGWLCVSAGENFSRLVLPDGVNVSRLLDGSILIIKQVGHCIFVMHQWNIALRTPQPYLT